MRIGILTANPRLYSTRRLKEACEARGHRVRLLDPLQFSVVVAKGDPTLLYKDRPLSRPLNAIVPRIGSSITHYGTTVVRQFEQMGVFCLNSAHAIATARDKLRSIQLLSRHDVGIPKTAFVRQRSSVLKAIADVGGAPVIVKLLEGTQGVGVILAETTKVAEAIVETLQTTRQNVLIQAFVKESKGRDIRAFVVGDRVVAAMRRQAAGEEFRSNVHRGGSVDAIRLEPEYERTAIRAAQIMGLRVAGVDMLEGEQGPLVMEVNSSPGLEGIEAATDLDVAGAVAAHVEQQADFPDIDVRQRLTLKGGYGVAEFRVSRRSPLNGTTLQEADLRDNDVLVLSIRRGDDVIPNPRGNRKLLAGDSLLCYGNLDRMSRLIPERRRGRKKKPSEEQPLPAVPPPPEDHGP